MVDLAFLVASLWVICFVVIGVRVALAPALMLLAVLFIFPWPHGHLVALRLVCVIVVELCLHGFHELPFACSYLPGQPTVRSSILRFEEKINFQVEVNGDCSRLRHITRTRFDIVEKDYAC